jgi:Rrf2 family protein
MILTRTTQYAIQTMVYMCMQERGTPLLVRSMAEQLSVPAPYLAKILQQLGRAGLVSSTRGRTGGFRLCEGAEDTRLISLLTLIEGPGIATTCVLGLKTCEDRTACPMHAQWSPIKARVLALLEDRTVGQLAAAVRSGRHRIADLPLAR